MPRRTGVSGPPAAYVAEGTWPDGEIPDVAPVGVAYAQAIARRLRAALATESVSRVATSAGLARSTLHDLVAGRTWPDVVTLAKLETTLDVRLWPDVDEVGRPS